MTKLAPPAQILDEELIQKSVEAYLPMNHDAKFRQFLSYLNPEAKQAILRQLVEGLTLSARACLYARWAVEVAVEGKNLSQHTNRELVSSFGDALRNLAEDSITNQETVEIMSAAGAADFDFKNWTALGACWQSAAALVDVLFSEPLILEFFEKRGAPERAEPSGS